jgi:hypothetical protein
MLIAFACSPSGRGPADASSTADASFGLDSSAAADADLAPDATTAADASTPDAVDNRPINPTWQAKGSTPPATPAGLLGAPMVLIPEQRKFILFGGATYPSPVRADTWSYSIDDGTWTQIQASNPPPPRFCHCEVYLPDTHEVLLVGGRDFRSSLPPAAWTLDLATSTWTQVQGMVPTGVIGCLAAWMPDYPAGPRAIVFGGYTEAAINGDTWAYDPAMHQFEKLHPASSPTPRGDGRAAYDPGPVGGHGRMLVQAGLTDAGYVNDLWAFDGMTWTVVQTGTTAKPAPRRVQGEGFDPSRREWVMFDGTIDSSDFADFWLFDAKTDKWTALPMSGVPSARGFSSTAYVPGDDAYYVFGGFSQPMLKAFSDGYVLHLR